MKIAKFLRILAAVCLISAGANALEEGVNYQVLQKPLNVPKNSVVKIFNYECPHCYAFDRTVTPQLMKKLEGTEFLPWHLKTKGVFGQTASGIFAALIALDEKDDVSLLSDESKFKKAKFAIYKAIHDKKDDFGGGSDKQRFIKTALDAAGVSMSAKAYVRVPRGRSGACQQKGTGSACAVGRGLRSRGDFRRAGICRQRQVSFKHLLVRFRR